ncbi:MAG: hypothetical protein HXX08_17815 [Chloroflexi bacterium]|uniref:Uncharacterized protein n=1 Tax=Candidatus Chlorohelix allophototropha TaxID=3003348 RepID=A0A8T7M6N1_9CHLR|nr:hypothetical protein [Chloroflexota bacterium]WJW69619.1 hypothetical protein OZ401_003246 [Chloroflexota bacterium L227-S17]
MKLTSLKQRLGLGIASLLLAGSVALGPVQAFAAPTDNTMQTVAVQTSQLQTSNAPKPDVSKIKDKVVTRLNERLDKLNTRITTVTDKLSKATTDAQKDKLQKLLTKLQDNKQKLEALLVKVQKGDITLKELRTLLREYRQSQHPKVGQTPIAE